MVTYTLSSKVYLDTHNKCYKKIIIINDYPEGPLQNYVSNVKDNKLSIFQERSVCQEWKPCFYAIHYPGQSQHFFTIDHLPELFSLLTTNGYTIDTQLTQMINQSQTVSVDGIICFITYS